MRTRGRIVLTGMTLSILVLAGAVRAGEWTAFRGGADRGGNADGGEVPLGLTMKWVYRGKGSGTRIDSSPAIVESAVYVGVSENSVFSPAGRVICVELDGGKPRWEKKTRRPVFSSPAVSGGLVLVGEGYHQDRQCRLMCLGAADGAEKWSFEVKSHIESSPQLEGGRVYFGAGDDGLFCLDVEAGKELWRSSGQHVDISPWAASGYLFAGTGYGRAAALALSTKDGAVAWQTPMDLPVWGSPLLLGNRLYLGLGNGDFLKSAAEPRGGVVCLSALGGKEVWRTAIPDAVLTALTHHKDRLFFGSRDGHLYALDAVKGGVLWKRPVGGPVLASPLVGRERVLAVSGTGRLVIAAIETGEELASLDLSKVLEGETGVFSSPALAAGKVVLGTTGGALVCLAGKE
jgi:outer membrane protein assembly factor BamB